jgi:hypothetical protein
MVVSPPHGRRGTLVTVSDPTPGLGALRDMRRARQRRRVGNVEWFDVAYRVYVVALFGGGAALWLSGQVGDGEVSLTTAQSVAAHGPSIVGLFVAVAFATGLRSGARGGPLAVEAADVHHALLAPIGRGRLLARPAAQRTRAALFAGTIGGAFAGQLAGRRLPGTVPAWMLGGALFGCAVALLAIGAAFVSHGLGIRLWPLASPRLRGRPRR